MPPARSLPSWSGIEAAADVIDPVFRDSPLVNSPTLDEAVGLELFVKVETLNPIRSFKGRGASWFVAGLAGDGVELVTASAGNFGQGLAHAARRIGRSVTVFAAATANPGKIAAMRRLGATVVLAGNDFDTAKAAAVDHCREVGGRLVIDGDEPRIAEGAGTIARELTRAADNLDAIFVPLGNGALATGIGTWTRHAAPDTRVVAVAAAGAPAMARSFRCGGLVTTETVDTIADGIAVRVPDSYALDAMRVVIDEVIEVGDASIVAAMRLAHDHLGLVVEPAGAAGLAGLIARPEAFAGRRAATVLCGANIDKARVGEWLYAGSSDGLV